MQNNDSKIAVKSGYYFLLFEASAIPYLERLEKKDYQVKYEDIVYDIYDAKTWEDTQLINDLFGDRMGFDIDDYKINKEEDLDYGC